MKIPGVSRPVVRAVIIIMITVAAGVLMTSANPERGCAGVFNMPRFVTPGVFAIGIEPELTFSNGAGMGFNAKYTHGMTDMSNLIAIIGTGSGARRLRAGAAWTFDFFPDIEGQPGIGLGVQSIYWRLKESGRFDLTLLPYIHKTFVSGGTHEFEPFLSIPFGLGFTTDTYKPVMNVALGCMFKGSEHLRYSIEVAVAILNSDSYVSGGIVYYY